MAEVGDECAFLHELLGDVLGSIVARLHEDVVKFLPRTQEPVNLQLLNAAVGANAELSSCGADITE